MSLSPREQQVLALVSEGASDKAIGATLFICRGTVRTHIRNILTKLQAKNRTQAAVIYVRAEEKLEIDAVQNK